MSLPFFSIVIVTHARASLLRRSIQSLTHQAFDDYEIIVVSDEGSSATYDVVQENLREHDVFVKRNGTPGPARSRNIGLELSQGRFVLFLDDDDMHEENSLSDLRARIETLPGDIFYFDFDAVTESRSEDPPKVESRTQRYIGTNDIEDLMVGNFIANSAYAISSSVAKRFTFDITLRSHEDWDFLMAMLHAGCRFTHVPILGVSIHYDPNDRRRNEEARKQGDWALDFQYIYRRWPVKTSVQREQRQAIIRSLEQELPSNML
jgi:glycosyltransferase involved in cell wall biosynthesis